MTKEEIGAEIVKLNGQLEQAIATANGIKGAILAYQNVLAKMDNKDVAGAV